MIPTVKPLRERYGEVDRLTAGYRKSIKSHDLLVEPVFKACRFNFSRSRTTMLDAMSGPGGLGLELLAMFDRQRPRGNTSELAIIFNDVRKESIQQILGAFSASFGTFNFDVCEVNAPTCTLPFNVAAMRYGLTELTKNDQEAALKAIYNCLLPGGRLVVADMTAYNFWQQDGITRVHSARQGLAGRDVEKEGICHIPTINEWTSLAFGAGFVNVAIAFTGTNDVSVSQWAGEFDDGPEQKIRTMNRIIKETAEGNESFKNGCAVEFGHAGASLKLPVIVLTGDKPA